MLLTVESDCSYLSEPKAHSRWAGFHFLGEANTASLLSRPNSPIHAPCQILKEVVSSTAEGALATVFHNAKESCPLHICLDKLGHLQPPTPIITDNTTTAGIANDTIKQKRSKAIDMRFYWIRDQIKQGQFTVLWRKGLLNRTDYMTKHHSAKHHRDIRSAYLHDPNARTHIYFDVLQETANAALSVEPPKYAATPDPVSASMTLAIHDSESPGEGVLIPLMPADPRQPALAVIPITNHSSNH